MTPTIQFNIRNNSTAAASFFILYETPSVSRASTIYATVFLGTGSVAISGTATLTTTEEYSAICGVQKLQAGAPIASFTDDTSVTIGTESTGGSVVTITSPDDEPVFSSDPHTLDAPNKKFDIITDKTFQTADNYFAGVGAMDQNNSLTAISAFNISPELTYKVRVYRRFRIINGTYNVGDVLSPNTVGSAKLIQFPDDKTLADIKWDGTTYEVNFKD